jgi:hypothetical protein
MREDTQFAAMMVKSHNEYDAFLAKAGTISLLKEICPAGKRCASPLALDA